MSSTSLSFKWLLSEEPTAEDEVVVEEVVVVVVVVVVVGGAAESPVPLSQKVCISRTEIMSTVKEATFDSNSASDPILALSFTKKRTIASIVPSSPMVSGGVGGGGGGGGADSEADDDGLSRKKRDKMLHRICLILG